MKACVNTKYGPPECVQIREIEKPIPLPNEVLIRVHASTVNRTDCAFRGAANFLTRLVSGLIKPKHVVLGNEFAGVIEALGQEVKSFQVGERVFGYNDKQFGAHAEYLVMPADSPISTMPKQLSFEEAAPMCEGAHYALCNIRAAKVSKQDQVLIYGASGGIGSAAVQLVKQTGAKVTAVCNTKNLERIQLLGADRVIDYTREDFTQSGESYDFILDAVGKSSFAQCRKLLKKKGIYISTELGKNAVNIPLAIFTPLFGGKKLLFPIPQINQADVVFLKELAEANQYKPVIDKIYPFDHMVEAYQYVETGQKTGNVVIQIVP